MLVTVRIECARCEKPVEIPDGAIAILGEFVCANCRLRQRDVIAAAVARRNPSAPAGQTETAPRADRPRRRRGQKSEEVEKLARELDLELGDDPPIAKAERADAPAPEMETGPLSGRERLEDLRAMAAPPSAPRRGHLDDELAGLHGDYFSELAPAPITARSLGAPAPPDGAPAAEPATTGRASDRGPRQPELVLDFMKSLPRSAWIVLGVAVISSLIVLVSLRRSGSAPVSAPSRSVGAVGESPVAPPPTFDFNPSPAPVPVPAASEDAPPPAKPADSARAPHGAASTSTPSASTSPTVEAREFDKSAASAALSSAAGRAASCKKPGDPAGGGKVRVTFAPSGRVTQATVESGALAGTPAGSCVAKLFQAVHIAPFSGGPVIVTRSVVVP